MFPIYILILTLCVSIVANVGIYIKGYVNYAEKSSSTLKFLSNKSFIMCENHPFEEYLSSLEIQMTI